MTTAEIVFPNAATVFAAVCACIFTVVGIAGKCFYWLHVCFTHLRSATKKTICSVNKLESALVHFIRILFGWQWYPLARLIFTVYGSYSTNYFSAICSLFFNFSILFDKMQAILLQLSHCSNIKSYAAMRQRLLCCPSASPTCYSVRSVCRWLPFDT